MPDGERLIHTDGTGFISENLAKKCPSRIIMGKKSKVGTLVPELAISFTETYILTVWMIFWEFC